MTDTRKNHSGRGWFWFGIILGMLCGTILTSCSLTMFY